MYAKGAHIAKIYSLTGIILSTLFDESWTTTFTKEISKKAPAQQKIIVVKKYGGTRNRRTKCTKQLGKTFSQEHLFLLGLDIYRKIFVGIS